MALSDRAGFPLGCKVLVTGATGFTGAVLVRKLCERGAQVRVLVRSSSRREALRDLPIEWIEGDVYDPATVARAAAGVEYLFHVAAAYREPGITDDLYRKVHVESTQLLARALAGQPGFRRFVHVSTVGVHGHIEHPPANEEYPFSPGDVYQQTKAEAEVWLRDYAACHALPFTVVRPAAIYGPGDKRLLKIFRMARWAICPILGSSRGQLYHLIHVDDLTEIILHAAAHPAAENQVFIAGDPEALPLVEILSTIGQAYGRIPRFVRIPAAPFFWAASLCEAICRPFGWSPPLYRRRVAFFTKDRSFDTSKVQDRLAYAYRHGTREGLRDTARWYRAQGWVNG